MAKKKRSYTERMKHERLKEAREAERKRRSRKNLIITLVSIVLIAAVIVGLVFGIGAIKDAIREANRKPEDDYSAYKNTWVKEHEDHEFVHAEIKVEGYDAPIKLTLDKTVAPKTVENFVKLAKDGFYDGLTFHRILENFMIQGGDPSADGTGGNVDKNGNKVTIKGEFSKNGHDNDMKHLRGVISMARGDNYDSASSQFFICNADASLLDGSYAAFGFVTEGLITVDKITEDKADYGAEDGLISKKRRQPVIEYVRITDGISLDENEVEEDLFD